jgi:hypothetical protein
MSVERKVFLGRTSTGRQDTRKIWTAEAEKKATRAAVKGLDGASRQILLDGAVIWANRLVDDAKRIRWAQTD